MAAYPFPEFWELQQAGQYDNPIPTRLAPTDCIKIPVLACRYDNSIPTRFLAHNDCFRISALCEKNPRLDDKMAAYPFPEFWELQQAGQYDNLILFGS
jgi:hypothetical protein